MPNYQGVWSLSTQYQNRTGWPTFFQVGTIGINGPGADDGTAIQKIDISSTGNATDFGDMAQGSGYNQGAVSNTERAIFGAGSGFSNIIQFITIAADRDWETSIF